jgi:hypothetical protein
VKTKFEELVYGRFCIIICTIILRNNNFISKLNYLAHSFLLPTNMCYFMFMIFILIQIKFDIEINNDELLKTIWEHKREKIDCHE